MATTAHPDRLEAGRRNFTRILVGVDGSQQSLEAARQAALLLDPTGELTLLSAWEIAPVYWGDGSYAPYDLAAPELRAGAEKSLATARDYVAIYALPTAKLVRGPAVPELLAEIERDQDSLVAVGSSGAGRLLGVIEGSVATSIIHRAPCSVLLVRPAKSGFPRRVAVGVDGSVESAAAYAAARYLAERFDAELRAVVARGGKHINELLVATITEGEHDEIDEPPTEALMHAAESADLVVVGSRGLHGLAALGSVSERVAHAAACTTLVVREPAWQRIAADLGR